MTSGRPPFATRAPRGRRQPLCLVALGVTSWLCLTPSALAAPTCTVSTPGLAFGAYDVYAAGPTNGTGTLTVACNLNPPPGNADISYTISLATGSSNSFVQRQMKSGANTLGYNLYTSNTYSTVWGDGTGSAATVSGSFRLTNPNPSQSRAHTVYGRIPALQDAAVANNYSDNVTVTVTY